MDILTLSLSQTHTGNCVSGEMKKKESAGEQVGEEEDGQEVDPSRLTIPTVLKVMQWLMGQGYKPLLLSEQEVYKTIFKFDHECRVECQCTP